MQNKVTFSTLLIILFYSFSSPVFAFKKVKQIQVLLHEGKVSSLASAVKGIAVKGGNVVYGGNESKAFVGGVAIFTTDKKITKGKHYTGLFKIYKEGNKVFVVNQVSIEDYLAGVLIGEISYSWPDAAIQAQAIAARSYAFYLIEKNKNQKYHIVSTERAQVFHGTYTINENLKKNIFKTKSKVLTSRGKPIMSFFHATCGGKTARTDEAWGKTKKKPLVYFQNVRCYYCKTHLHYSWRFVITKKLLHQKLSGVLQSGQKIRNIKLEKTLRSKRVQQVVLSTSGKTIRLKASKFRLLLGNENVRSLLFSFKKSGNKIVFEGKGFGHGVGLCQWGAKTMAEKGYNSRAILKFYYKNTVLRNL